MAWNDGLIPNTPAHSIAASNEQRICVLAGPGTGKSFSMKRRVARLLEEEGVAPENILAVTFTRVAADDLHRELVSLGVPGADALVGRTLHSLAMSILMRNHVLNVLGRHPRPLNEFEIEPLLCDLSVSHGNKHQRRRLIKSYGAAWARLQTDDPGYAVDPADQAFEDELIEWLQIHEAMLMNEVVPHLLQYLRANPGCQELNEFTHLLIDEYQDLNRAEQEVLQLLGTNGAMCVIGDDDQSIYSFKHAHPEGIQQWPNQNTSENHAIDDCYRCPLTVVRMANVLIARNPNRVARVMTEMDNKGPGEVVIRQYPSAEAEGDAVATKIRELIDAGISPGEIIVLAQRNTFAHPIYMKLREAGIPVKSYYAESALDSDEAQEKFALLKILNNNEDRVALRWLLGRGLSNWYCKPYSRILNYVRESGSSPWQTLKALADGTLKIPYTGKLVSRYQVICAAIAKLEAAENFDQFLELWLPDNEELQLLSGEVEKIKDDVTTPQELLEKLSQVISQPDVPLEVTEVRVMSLHKSKGLSSPYVFIVGCIEGLLPGQLKRATQAERDAKLQEDRRLFYVGITRVKSKLPDTPDRPGYLALTHPQTMRTADVFTSQITPVSTANGIAQLLPSRFLAEMAPHAPAAQFNTPL